ncbi:MAG: hypothetical protein A2201_02100 [Alicyclobacillus sp. RIFOXYA1_FULL_53_8]|nr:MAG: hypothetical protein A2201_02100 [Alicyclobacillus sp. RIFOXYA1_FULL_53_8]
MVEQGTQSTQGPQGPKMTPGTQSNQSTQSARDLVVTGTGTASGGDFDKVKVIGEGNVDGDLASTQVKVRGVINVHGHLKTGRMQVVGTAYVGGNLQGDEVAVTGTLQVTGDCSAEKLKVRGGFSVDGLLNAENLDIALYGPARAKEIGGGIINIRPRFRIFSHYKRLTVDTVEGDEVRLHYTSAKVVRGNKVYVGPGCEIELVEYKDDFQQAKSAKVTEHRRR